MADRKSSTSSEPNTQVVEAAALSLWQSRGGGREDWVLNYMDGFLKDRYRRDARQMLDAVGYQALLDVAEAAQRYVTADPDMASYYYPLAEAVGKLPQIYSESEGK